MTISFWFLAEDKIRSGQHLGTGGGTLPHYPRGPTDATQHFWWKYQHRFAGRVTQTPVVDHRLLTHTIDLVIHRSIACPGLMEWQVWPLKQCYPPIQDLPCARCLRNCRGTISCEGPRTPSRTTKTSLDFVCIKLLLIHLVVKIKEERTDIVSRPLEWQVPWTLDPVCREPFYHEEGFLVPHFRRRLPSHIRVHISAGGHRIFLQPELVWDLQVGVYFPSRLGGLLCQLRHHGRLCWGGPGTGQTTGAVVVSSKFLPAPLAAWWSWDGLECSSSCCCSGDI